MNSNNYIEQKKNAFLYFKLGDNKYAINSDNVLEIMKLPALEYPQKLPNSVVGLLKYNNFVINVVDIRFYLDIEATPYTINNELLIVKTDEIIFGLITDKIIGIQAFSSALTDALPFVDNKTVVDSIYKYKDETIYIINIYAIENILKQHEINNSVNIPSLFPKDEHSVELMNARTTAILEKANLKLASAELYVKNKYISFNLNEDFYCIALDYVREVMKDTVITKIPGLPDFIAGVMHLRGDYITVIDLKRFLNLPKAKQSADKNPVIIIKYNELKLALLIDKINELFEFQENNTAESSDGYYCGEFIYNNTLYTALNVEKISSDKRILITDM